MPLVEPLVKSLEMPTMAQMKDSRMPKGRMARLWRLLRQVFAGTLRVAQLEQLAQWKVLEVVREHAVRLLLAQEQAEEEGWEDQSHIVSSWRDPSS